MHELIELHRVDPSDAARAAALGHALEITGPVLTDDGEVVFLAGDGRVRSFRLGAIKSARAIPVPRRE